MNMKINEIFNNIEQIDFAHMYGYSLTTPY